MAPAISPEQRACRTAARRRPHAAAAMLTAWMALASAPPLQAVESIVVKGLFKDKAVVDIDGRRRVLTLGKPSPEGVVLISADTEGAVLEIDGQQREYPLGTHISSRYPDAPTGATLRLWPDAAGMYTVTGSVNGFSMRFLVDTGASMIAMNKHEAKRIGLDYRLNGLEGTVETASGVHRAFYVVLDRVRVGDIELRDVNATVIDGDYPREVLLGNSFLGRLDLVRDGKMLELQKK